MFCKTVMLRTVVRLSPSFAIPFFAKKNIYDHDLLHEKESPKPTTGWDRVKNMYLPNEYEETSVELTNVVQATMFGCFVGACFGGFIKSRDAYVYFIESNQASIFSSTFDAKRKLQDYVTIAFAKGACRWGWRLGIFTGMFSTIATTISVYRGDTSLVEYVTAGALTGAIYKANLGTAAMAVGGLLGATLSGIGGLLILGILKVTGLSMADIRKALYKLRQARQETYDEVLEKAAEEKHDDLTRHHDMVVAEKGTVNVQELP